MAAGYKCTEHTEAGAEDLCSRATGIAAFYDATGTLTDVEVSGPLVGDAAQPSAGDNDTVVFTTLQDEAVVGADGPAAAADTAFTQMPKDSVVTCALGQPARLSSVVAVYQDPEAPEDSLSGYRLVTSEGPTSDPTTIAEFKPTSLGATFPICTPSGLIIGNIYFDGSRVREFQQGDLAEVTKRTVVGVTADGLLLGRQTEKPDGSALSPEPNDNWIGISEDGTVGVRVDGGTYEFIEL